MATLVSTALFELQKKDDSAGEFEELLLEYEQAIYDYVQGSESRGADMKSMRKTLVDALAGNTLNTGHAVTDHSSVEASASPSREDGFIAGMEEAWRLIEAAERCGTPYPCNSVLKKAIAGRIATPDATNEG